MAWYKEMFATLDPARFEIYAESEESRQQVDFIIDKLALEPGARILDLCCGQGRHLIELARRGYDVVGLDLSEYMLGECRTAAAAAGVDPVLIHADMREINRTNDFDAVINMFTAFGYLESDDEDQKVINAASLALKGGGLLLLDLMNRDRLMNVFKPVEWHENSLGDLILSEREFDPLAGRVNAREVTIHYDGRRSERSHSLRLYTFNELDRMLRQAGLNVQAAYGDFDSTPFSRLSRRMIVIARKERQSSHDSPVI